MSDQPCQPVQSLENFPGFFILGGINNLGNTIIRLFIRHIDHSFLREACPDNVRAEGWPRDLLDMLYLDEQTLAWAQKMSEAKKDEVKRVDCNGAVLKAGDTITIIKDLDVKGTSFTAKRGTAVRGISLVADNPEQIEGRVNGHQIVILTRFVKKAK